MVKPVDFSVESFVSKITAARRLRRAAWLRSGGLPAPGVVYRCGDCPVCSVMGDLLLFEDIRRRTPFLYCADCGCAFDHRPTEVDSLNPLEMVAPDGFRLPRGSTVIGAETMGWEPAPVGALDDEWRERLGPGFRESTEDQSSSEGSTWT